MTPDDERRPPTGTAPSEPTKAGLRVAAGSDSAARALARAVDRGQPAVVDVVRIVPVRGGS